MYHKLIVIGNLGRDPEMRYLPDGTAVTNFSVASNRRFTNPQTQEPGDETTWFRVSVWGRQAETTNQFLSKGSRVLVEGRLQPDEQTGSPRLYTRQDGTVGASFELRAQTVRFLSGPREDAPYNGEEAAGAEVTEDAEVIPF